MVDASIIVLFAIAYIGVLFAIAWGGDVWMKRRPSPEGGRPFIYALSIGVYCTTWTFFGSVGRASSTGWDFLAVYIGPALVFLFGWPLLLRIIRLAKAQNITSIADFLAARYGKSPMVAGTVTIVSLIGLLPYLALQLKAVVLSTEALFGGNRLYLVELPSFGVVETAFVTTVVMAAFAVLFGTRHIDATEHQDGLMAAIAAESLVKLVAFLSVGIFVVFYAFGDVTSFYKAAMAHGEILERFTQSSSSSSTWLIVTVLSAICIVVLPRQFHVTVVENRSENELFRARWLLPLYLFLINLFVVPIAIAGLILIRPELANPDVFVLTVPIELNAKFITVLAYIGGLSAATAMIVVESIALAIMVCNGVVVPLLLRYQMQEVDSFQHMSRLLLTIRRLVICMLLALCYGVYLVLGEVGGLAAIGLMSFAAIAQLAPAFFGGLFWQQANARGAVAGILTGMLVWAYTLLLPWIIKAGLLPMTILTDGPLSLAFLKPEALFYFEADPLTHGVLWSFAANIAAYFAFSRSHTPSPIERLQASVFVSDDPLLATQPSFRFWRTSITVGDLEATVGRYLGRSRAERSFQELHSRRNRAYSPESEADVQTVRFTEHLLTSAIGAASSRLVLTLLLRRRDVTNQSALSLLDDASEALQYNRDILQSALDEVRHGLCVFNRDHQLVCWNRQFSELLVLPRDMRRIGIPLEQILMFLAERGDMGSDASADELVARRLDQLSAMRETFQERLLQGQKILEVRTAPMPQGGFVTTYSDITERVAAADALAQANQNLEERVKERTAELLKVNAALAHSKRVADEANRDKTRFLAAASHDILQPLNAARLYATALVERDLADDNLNIAKRIDTSLTSVEEILKVLVDISRMDAGRLEPEISVCSIQELFEALKVEFDPVAREAGLDLKFVGSSLWVRSDRKLLRRVLQNLIANAIKYTPKGRVLVGIRRRAGTASFEVLDTGMGIPKGKRAVIFQEFLRLDPRASGTRGLGLGLSIVERISRIVEHPIGVHSVVGQGSRFTLGVPSAAAAAVVPVEPKVIVGSKAAFQNMSVVCIDNEPEVLGGMRTMLEGWGCHVLAASDTAGALKGLDENSPIHGGREAVMPTAIVADYHLDEGTGVDAILAIRDQLGAAIPGVIITADHSPEVQRELRELELTLLRKPLKAAALRAVLMQSMRQMAAE